MEFKRELTVGDLLTASSLILAILLACVGHQLSGRAAVQSHTVDLLAMISNNERIAESDLRMARWIKNETRFHGEVDVEIDRHVINLLDFYEYLATAWKQGILDGDVLLYVRGGAMSRAYDVCEQYIEDRRRVLQAPNLYRNYEELVLHYRKTDLGI